LRLIAACAAFLTAAMADWTARVADALDPR
jgi:uncharacterized protein involved in response to NO